MQYLMYRDILNTEFEILKGRKMLYILFLLVSIYMFLDLSWNSFLENAAKRYKSNTQRSRKGIEHLNSIALIEDKGKKSLLSNQNLIRLGYILN